MLKINSRYLATEAIRHNSTTIQEVFAGLVVDKFIYQNDVLNVGEKTNLNLPDVFNDSKTVGFEVAWLEKDIDYLHKDLTDKLIKINFKYDEYLKIKGNDPSSVINKNDWKLTVENGKITSTSPGCRFYSVKDYMRDECNSVLEKKMNKLNKGLYQDCKNVSLIVLNYMDMSGQLIASILQEEYINILKKYNQSFNLIYLITTNAIFCVSKNNIKKLDNFSNNEYNLCMDEIDKILCLKKTWLN